MKLSSSHTSSGAPGGCQTSPVITLTMAPMTHLPSCESAPSTTHCSVQRPAEQARPTAAGGSQALPVPAAHRCHHSGWPEQRPQEEQPWAWDLRPQPLFITKAQETSLRNAPGNRQPATSCLPQAISLAVSKSLPVFEASGRGDLRVCLCVWERVCVYVSVWLRDLS